MVHITALALVPAAPPGFPWRSDGMEPFPRMRPRHHGEFSAASPHGRLDRWLIVRRPSRTRAAQGGTGLRRAGG